MSNQGAKVNEQVKYWLDRLSMMGKSAVVELHPRDTAKMFKVFSKLAEEREALEELFVKEVQARAVAEIDLATLKSGPAQAPKKKKR